MRQPALDVRIGWRRELRRVLGRRAHRDLEVVGAESRQRRLDEDGIGLDLARSADEDERMLDIREEGRRLGRRFPDPRPHHPERRRQLDAGGPERRRRVVEMQRRAPHAVGVGQGLQPDGLPRAVEHVEARRCDLERHHGQVPWHPGREGEVLEQRDRHGPRDRSSFGDGCGSDRRHVDQQTGRVDVLDGPGDVGHLVLGSCGEGGVGDTQALLGIAPLPVVERDRLDLGGDRLCVKASRAQGGHLGRERADVDVVAAIPQLEQGGDDRVQMPASGRRVGEIAAHQSCPSSLSIRSINVRSVSARLRPRSRRSSFQV